MAIAVTFQGFPMFSAITTASFPAGRVAGAPAKLRTCHGIRPLRQPGLGGFQLLTQPFEIHKDPRIKTTPQEFKEQFDLLIKIRDKVSEAHEAVNRIRDIRKQVDDLLNRLKDHPKEKDVAEAAKGLKEKLAAIEEEIIQVKIKSSQDALNYPIRLNNKLAALTNTVASADAKPTKPSYDVFNELSGKLDEQLAKLKQVLDKDLPDFNQKVKAQDIPAVILKQSK